MSALEAAIAEHERRGYRLEMIMPADAPRIAVVANGNERLRLTASPDGIRIEPFSGYGDLIVPEGRQEFVLTSASSVAWVEGRAGMQYRDLIPGRLGGRFIASHIRIPDGGPVADYVHHHRVRLQMIFVRKGWVRVVYEGQGPPFDMREGDCVLQPPGIRHRVLESSAALEVIEVSCPAEHETFRDHALGLPTPTLDPNREFAGQRFARHVAAEAPWRQGPGLSYQDTGIAKATGGLAGVRILRITHPTEYMHDGEFLFLVVLKGAANLESPSIGRHKVDVDDACTLLAGQRYTLTPHGICEKLEVALPAR
jgi:mannose-6-phosphate isomerase-like protein (cupin superfamily)